MVDCFNCKASSVGGYQSGWISITYSNKIQEHLKFLDQEYKSNNYYNRGEQSRNYCGYCGPYFQELEIKRLGAISIKNNNDSKIDELTTKIFSLESKLTSINGNIVTHANNMLTKTNELIAKDNSDKIEEAIVALKKEIIRLESVKSKSVEVNENLQNLVKASKDYWTSFDQYQEIRK